MAPVFDVPERSMSASDAAEFLCGVEQFNRGEFFAAHETWEAIWLPASGPDKVFLQGIIQLAAAFHHGQRGNLPGALSLSRRALEKLAVSPGCYRGIRVGRLREQASRWVENWENGSLAVPGALPKIEMASAPHGGADS